MPKKFDITTMISTTTMMVGFAIGLAAQPAAAQHKQSLLITADKLFDGANFAPGTGKAVLVENGRIAAIGSAGMAVPFGTRVVNVPGGTILPGFIDMHTHHLVNKAPALRLLEHGVTTARDLGGPVTPVMLDKPYQLRQILSGPIITARGGYPMPVFPGSGVEVSGAAAAVNKVRELVAKGASVIAVSLEPGGEIGAPWTSHNATTPPPWPTLTNAELRAVVTEAHRLKKRVVAYLGTTEGARRALDAGVDEWAHMPCDFLDHGQWHRAADRRLPIDGTLDTLVSCSGSAHNAGHAVEMGARLFYGTDLGHPDIPHGIDAQEIHHIVHAWTHAGRTWDQAMALALASATSEPGKYLYLGKETTEPKLGQLVVGAPADIVVIGSDPRQNFKELEFPRLVVSGGKVVIERAMGE